MDDKEFKELSEAVYARIIKAFDTVDPDAAEAYFHLDNVSLSFKDGTRFIINRQPPVKQLWLATKKRGLHFNYDKAQQLWICDKSGDELFDVLSEHCSEMLGFKINL